MTSSRAVFDLNNCKSGVNRHLGFVNFQKLGNVPFMGAYFNSEICSVWCHGLMNSTQPTRHTSEFFGNDKTAGAYSLQICDYLRQIQLETKAFLLIVRHNTEGPPFSDWQ